jgi:DNA-binding response OmpR family regulator
MNGRQLADAARATTPALPVLFITGYAGTALDSIRLAEGIEILRKPFALDELAARVAAILSRSAASEVSAVGSAPAGFAASRFPASQ